MLQVVAILGQSNAQGAGIGYDPVLDTPHPMVMQLPARGLRRGITVATEPLTHPVKIGQRVGPGLTFGKLMHAATRQPILLVPYAEGQTGFHPTNGRTWDPDDTTAKRNLYREGKVQIARALRGGNELAAIIWHQGEDDTWHLTQEQYAARLDRLIDDLRASFRTVPFIIGQMNPDRMAEGNDGYPGINAAHADTPNRRPLTAFVEGPTGMFNSAEEKIHYSAAGQRELGRRYWAAYEGLR